MHLYSTYVTVKDGKVRIDSDLTKPIESKMSLYDTTITFDEAIAMLKGETYLRFLVYISGGEPLSVEPALLPVFDTILRVTRGEAFTMTFLVNITLDRAVEQIESCVKKLES